MTIHVKLKHQGSHILDKGRKSPDHIRPEIKIIVGPWVLFSTLIENSLRAMETPLDVVEDRASFTIGDLLFPSSADVRDSQFKVSQFEGSLWTDLQYRVQSPTVQKSWFRGLNRV